MGYSNLHATRVWKTSAMHGREIILCVSVVVKATAVIVWHQSHAVIAKMRTASFVSIIQSVINVKQKQWYVMAVLSNQLAVFVMEVKVKFVVFKV